MKKVLILFTILFVIILCIIGVHADTNKLTINFEQNDVQFKVYDISKFDSYNIDYTDSDLTTYLVSLINRDKIVETTSGTIKNNTLTINLPAGYYLVTADNFVAQNKVYSMMPSIVKVENNVSIKPKFEKNTLEQFELSVLKTWKDDKNTHQEISVTLYENGSIKQTVKLNSSNSFKYTFKNLDRKNTYSVFEDKIPSGYKLKIVKSGDTFNLINEAIKKTTQTDVHEKLPQTGLLQWPVLLFICIAAVFLILSLIIKYKKSLIIVAFIFILLAIGLTIFNNFESLSSQYLSDKITDKIESQITSEHDITNDLSIENICPEMTTIDINGSQYIGILEIPSQGIKLPVSADWSEEQLKKSLCRYSGSIFTDNLTICGHNYKSGKQFGKLKFVSKDDKIYFKDVEGNIVTYIVKDIEILNPTDTLQAKQSQYNLTLFTCTYNGTKRLAIRCDRTL